MEALRCLEDELQHLWPLDEQDRQAKIAKFAKTHGLRLRFYRKGLCAIFDKWPRGEVTQPNATGFGHIKLCDLQPVKDVTGGGAAKGKSKPSAVRKSDRDAGTLGRLCSFYLAAREITRRLPANARHNCPSGSDSVDIRIAQGVKAQE